MPLIAWTTFTWSVTLILAFNGNRTQQVGLLACALLAAIGSTSLGRRIAATMSAVAAAAVLVAIGTEATESRCAASLVAAHEWTADFTTDVAEGDIARVVIVRDGCSIGATLLVSGGTAAAGDRAQILGAASSDSRGLFIEHAIIVSTSRSSVLLRVRAAAARRIDRIFGRDAPMARALIIADVGGIPPEQRDRFVRAGLVHLLNVSGLHIGIIALTLELLATILHIPRTRARVVSWVLLAVYVASIGAPAHALRPLVMLGAHLVSRLLQRPTSPWAILSLGALAPLWDPRQATEVGWQLTVVGTGALIAGSMLARRIVPSKWRGMRRRVASAVTMSLVVTVVTGPIVAWVFGTVALVGPLTNLVADPLLAVLEPLLFVAMSVPVHGVEAFVADAAHLLLVSLDAVARGGAAIPGGAPVVLPTMEGALAAGVAAAAVTVACVARRPARASLVAACAVAIIIVEPLLPSRPSAPELHMIDVGQGDALALRTSRGRWIVIDAGRSWIGGDAGRTVVAPYLARLGGDVALFVLSHPHADHVGGAASLFGMVHPSRFLDPGYVGTSAPYLAALAEASKDRIPWQRVRPGDSLVVDDVVLSMLAPDSAWASHLADANLASTVMVARVGPARVLFTGDAESPEEDWLLEHSSEQLRADVLKVGHHGSSTSTSPRFLEAVHPRIGLVSVGAHNSYGHPDAATMNALRDAQVATLRTDRLGTVVLRFDQGGIEVKAHGERWFVPTKS